MENLVAYCKFNSKEKETFKYKLDFNNVKIATLKENDLVYVTCLRKDKTKSVRPVLLVDIKPYENIDEITGFLVRKVRVGKKVQLKDKLCNEIIEEVVAN